MRNPSLPSVLALVPLALGGLVAIPFVLAFAAYRYVWHPLAQQPEKAIRVFKLACCLSPLLLVKP